MTSPQSPIPQPTEDGTDTLFSPEYNQTYHSTFGALTESEHVFLQSSGVAARLQAGKATDILEVGFGTGLNFWLTAQRAKENQARLHYVALEQYLLSTSTLRQLNHDQLPKSAAQVRTAFLGWREQLPASDSGRHQWQYDEYGQLELILGDATQVEIPAHQFHAIYHDAFSPEANPALWTADFFVRLYDRLQPGGTLATYSVKGTVRRALQQVGFQVEKQPGPPGKREILVARRLA